MAKKVSKRNFKPPTAIDPNEYELGIVRKNLVEFYEANPEFLINKSVDEQITNVVEKAKLGWTCAPKTFLGRVSVVSKWSTGSIKTHKKYTPSYYNEKQLKLQDEIRHPKKTNYPGLSAKDLRKLLPAEEQKFWLERESFYIEEFEFNNSSDWALLQQVITEELSQRRLTQTILSNPNANNDNKVDASNKRMIAALKALGITREQREAANNETEGNIAQLSKKYEEKMKYIDKLEEKQRLEEELMQSKKLDGSAYEGLPKEMADALISAEREEMKDLVSEDEEDTGEVTIV
jgi:hypothetical protein